MTDGEFMYSLIKRLWKLPRSITGDGVRETLGIIREHLPSLIQYEIPSGTKAYDWEVPLEWNVSEAWIETPDGERICDYNDHRLHLVGYSRPGEYELTLDQLQPHLYSLPEQRFAIPYVTAYYKPGWWGFCLPHRQRERLKQGTYRVHIKGSLKKGYMTLGRVLIPGKTTDEVLLSTYTCHPQMANDNLSGLAVATALGKWLAKRDNRYTYRILFMPETIGAIYYISRNLERLKERVRAGYVLTCMGDEGCWTFLHSRDGVTLADNAARHAINRLHEWDIAYHYWFTKRGSDERQYCAPGVDLPVAAVMRSKFHEYPEYHTSKDDLSFVTPKGLTESLQVMKRTTQTIEYNEPIMGTTICEPKLDKYGLHPYIGGRNKGMSDVLNLLAYADGRSLLDIAETIGLPAWELAGLVDELREVGLVE